MSPATSTTGRFEPSGRPGLSGSSRLFGLPEVGVGMTFSAAVLDSIDSWGHLIDAIEIEPQTLWTEHPTEHPRYRSRGEIDTILEDLPFRKLVHSIGLPVGGTAAHDRDQIRLLSRTIDRLEAPWFSEHLSFNRGPAGYTGFFLPPRQTAGGLERCVTSIRRLTTSIDAPMAIETGVNYLRPRNDEIDDGRFISLVAEQADCAILLDLHNVYTNARNGRQSIEQFVGQLDLDRVIEVHIAGGMELDGYWLDAHSGALPPDLIGPATEVIASLPNLKAIVFEVYPAFLETLDEPTIANQLEQVRELWEARGVATTPRQQRRQRPVVVAIVEPVAGPTADEWERDLAAMVTGHPAVDVDEHGHGDDPGVALLQKLSLEFRASMITTNLPRTTRLMLLALGEQVFRLFLDEFRQRYTPQLFAASEALAFAEFLADLDVGVPQLAGVLRFETAALRSRLDGETRVVAFDYDPFPMLTALGDRRLPDELAAAGRFEIEITGSTVAIG